MGYLEILTVFFGVILRTLHTRINNLHFKKTSFSANTSCGWELSDLESMSKKRVHVRNDTDATVAILAEGTSWTEVAMQNFGALPGLNSMSKFKVSKLN